jgi:hypothetical protein
LQPSHKKAQKANKNLINSFMGFVRRCDKLGEILAVTGF